MGIYFMVERTFTPLYFVHKLSSFSSGSLEPQVAQAGYTSSSVAMLTFALLRNSSDLHIYKDLYGERNKPERNPKNYR